MPRSVKEWVGKTDNAMPPAGATLRIFARAKGCCQGCMRRIMAGEEWHRDHIVPLADGGQNRESNFQILCKPCHTLKTSREATDRAKIRAKTKAAYGIKTPSAHPLKSRGFPKRLRPAPKPRLGPRDIYARPLLTPIGSLDRPGHGEDGE